MNSTSFFLRRAVARGADWQARYPALAMASSIDTVDERRKQIVVAAADAASVRMVFFSSLGSIIDFRACWTDMGEAKTWLAFTLRWNRWWMPDAASLSAVEHAAGTPTDVRLANRAIPGVIADDTAYQVYLDAIEATYRQDESISRVLFAEPHVWLATA